MVEAFHSTLEEIALSDIILLVVDASDPVDEMARRLRSSLRILWEFDGKAGAAAQESAPVAVRVPGIPYRQGLAPVVVALNKIDAVPPAELEAKRAVLFAESLTSPEMCVAVSAKTRAGLDALFARLYTLMPDYDEYEVALFASPESEAFIGWLHEHADVLDMTRGNEVHIHFEAKRSRRSELLDRLRALGATALREVQRGRVAEASPDAATAGGDARQDGDAVSVARDADTRDANPRVN